MLLEFSCSNYKAIKEKIVFSMVAGSDKHIGKNCMNLMITGCQESHLYMVQMVLEKVH